MKCARTVPLPFPSWFHSSRKLSTPTLLRYPSLVACLPEWVTGLSFAANTRFKFATRLGVIKDADELKRETQQVGRD